MNPGKSKSNYLGIISFEATVVALAVPVHIYKTPYIICCALMLMLIETEAGVGMGKLGKGMADGELCNAQDSSDKTEMKYARR